MLLLIQYSLLIAVHVFTVVLTLSGTTVVVPSDQWHATGDGSDDNVILPAPQDMLPDMTTSETSASTDREHQETPEVQEEQTVTGASRGKTYPAPMSARSDDRADRLGKYETERIVWCGNRDVYTRLLSKEIRIKCCKITSSLALKDPEETCHC